VAGLGERGTRLRLLAQELEEPPEVLTYFHVPPRGVRSGPGWYMGPSYRSLVYIGYSAASAEVYLIERLSAQEDKAAAK
jgi:hypothetical protein